MEGRGPLCQLCQPNLQGRTGLSLRMDAGFALSPAFFRVKRKKLAMRDKDRCASCANPTKTLSWLEVPGRVLYLDGPRLFFEIGTDFGTHA